MRNIIYERIPSVVIPSVIIIPSVLFGVYLYYNYYNYYKDKYVKSYAYDKYKDYNENAIEYHCVETYYRFYTEYKKYFYDENGEINRVEINYKYKF